MVPVKHSKEVQLDLFKWAKEHNNKKLPNNKPVGDNNQNLKKKAVFIKILKDKFESVPFGKKKVQVAKASRVLLALSKYVKAKREKAEAITDERDRQYQMRYASDQERREMEDASEKQLNEANKHLDWVLSSLPKDSEITDETLKEKIKDIEYEHIHHAQMDGTKIDPEIHYKTFAEILEKIKSQHPDFNKYYNHFLKQINNRKQYYMQKYNLKEYELPGLALFHTFLVAFSKRPDKIGRNVIYLLQFMFSKKI